jgi:hypothetical protein
MKIPTYQCIFKIFTANQGLRLLSNVCNCQKEIKCFWEGNHRLDPREKKSMENLLASLWILLL